MRSMTGYGRGSAAADGRELTIELKSVNHRYLDLGVRLPRFLNFLEEPIRVGIAARLSRGHVDVFLNYRNTRGDARAVEIDAPLLAAYVASAREANRGLGLEDDLSLSAALRLPDVAEIREADEDPEAVLSLTRAALGEAIDALILMREQEGGRLADDLNGRIDEIGRLAADIEERAPLVAEEYRIRLNERVETLLAELEPDRARLATELALFADRASVDEEIVRLKSHARQARLLAASGEPAGRKLDFVVQEMNREFNTIGSKANDMALTNLVLAGKAEIEKMREQVQNIE